MELQPGGFVVWLGAGLVAGALAALYMKDRGLGLIGDIVVGMVGAFIGGGLFRFLLPGITVGLIGSIVVAFVGAVGLITPIRAVVSRRDAF